MYIQNGATMWYEWTEYNFPTNTQCSSPPRGQTNFKNTPPVTGSTNWNRLSIYLELTTRTHTTHQIQNINSTKQFSLKSLRMTYPTHKLQWNLVIKRSDITQPSHNKATLQTPAPHISLFFTPTQREIRYNKATLMVPRTSLQRGSTVFWTVSPTFSHQSPYTYRYRQTQ